MKNGREALRDAISKAADDAIELLGADISYCQVRENTQSQRASNWLEVLCPVSQ